MLSGTTMMTQARLVCSLLSVLLCCFALCSCEAPAKVNVATPTCSYTLVVNEFDVSKCSTMNDHVPGGGTEAKVYNADDDYVSDAYKEKSEHITILHEDNVGRRRHNPRFSGPVEADKRTAYSAKSNSKNLNSRGGSNGGGGAGESYAVVGLSSQVADIESKLLDEMVRSRELKSTLSRHESLFLSAQDTLDSYNSNFTHIFRAMMLMERQLKHQRRINRSLNKKLSNVILDVVEVNKALTTGTPTGDAARGRKVFAVQSGSELRACPAITETTRLYKDCQEVYSSGHHSSDVYYIKPLYSACPIPVWCDMDSPKAGWLVFQRRRDGSVNFNRKWDEYRHGFGDVSGEHWLGNDNLFLLTNQGRYQLRIDLWDFSGNRVHAIYSNFKIEGERDGYLLHASGYSGSAHDSLHKHNNKRFSTLDRDHDGRREANCAQEWEAGWWFDHCWVALLNGPYHNRSDLSWRGISWNGWKREQLRASEMKLKPVK